MKAKRSDDEPHGDGMETALESNGSREVFSTTEENQVDPDPMETELIKRLSILRSKAESHPRWINPTFRPETGVSSNQKAKLDFEHTYLSCERDKCKKWAQTLQFEIVSETEQLSGFKIYVVEDWAFNSNERCCIVCATKKPNDKIFVSVVKPRPTMSKSQLKIFKNHFIKGSQGEFDFVPAQTPFGTILLSEKFASTVTRSQPSSPLQRRKVSPSETNSSLIFIPSGDFDESIGRVRLLLNLKRLGCAFYPISLEDDHFISSMDERLKNLYGISKYIPIHQAVERLVKEIKAALLHLNYLSDGTSIDGWFDNTTVKALKQFQKNHNIKETGFLNGSTYQSLLEQVMQLKAQIEKAGFECRTDDPFKDYILFNHTWKEYNKNILCLDVNSPFSERVSEENGQPLKPKAPPISLTKEIPDQRSIFEPSPPSSPVTAKKMHPQSSLAAPFSPTFLPITGVSLRTSLDSSAFSSKNAKISSFSDHVELPTERDEIEYFKANLQRQQEEFLQCLTYAENLEKKYFKLQQEANAAFDSIKQYKDQLKSNRAQLNKIQFRCSHFQEILKEHETTIENYRAKISLLEGQVQQMQRESRRNIITKGIKTLASALLYLFAVLILCITTVLDFIKKHVLGSGPSITQKTKQLLITGRKKISLFSTQLENLDTEEEENNNPNIIEDTFSPDLSYFNSQRISE